MRIPLDYYRILGLPIQAAADQLKQAHRDRTLQLPRREYSEIAIKSRKSLIDEAYIHLCEPQKRKTYDVQFLARTYVPDTLDSIQSVEPSEKETTPLSEFTPQMGEETLRAIASNTLPPPSPEPYTPTIEVSDSQFVGALLILLELGEYELVIRLGRPFVSNGNGSLASGSYGDPSRVQQDIVLTLALACLELGREQWQQNHYENAAESLETGQELLLQENQFPAIRSELQADLFKLRPYRILELVARPLDQNSARRQGIQLLKAMLQDRGGIDGVGDDLSGLSTDDFLRFIQQLRGYLTAGEQQEIFEAEARRPSAVATYLAVYALLARGFSFHQPSLIRRAKQLLQPVSTRQDVHLEQAVCALLLGQAEEAGRALELSQEYEPLAFIREHSQKSPDLLPGLCLYAERWLREEVFTHFRDLANQQTALKDYFADPQVQAFLEAIPAPPAVESVTSNHKQPSTSEVSLHRDVPFAAPPVVPSMQSSVTAAYAEVGQSSTIAENLGTAPPSERSTPVSDNGLSDNGLSVAERVSQLSPDGHLQSASATMPPPPSLRNGHRPSAVVSPTPAEPEPSKVSVNGPRSPHWGRLVAVLLMTLLTVGALGFVTVRTLSWIAGLFGGPKIQKPALDIGLTTSPIPIPTPPAPEAQISVSDIAERTINNWLSAKKTAMGPDHDLSALETALSDPALTRWRNKASEGQQGGSWHYEYEHTLEITRVEPDDPAADVLTVEAQVTEVADYYEFGTRNGEISYNQDLNMRYDLIRQGGEWFVQDMTVVE